MNKQSPRAPIAKKKEKLFCIHGQELSDPWHWLRDKDDPDLIKLLQAENAYTDYVMEPNRQLRQSFFDELKGRMKEDDSSVAVKEGPYAYYMEVQKGAEYPLYFRKKVGEDNAKAELLLDVNQLAQGKSFLEVGFCVNSPDHRLLIYGVDEQGDESFMIYIKDLASGKLLSDRIPNTCYGAEWTNDSRSFYYTVLDDKHRPKWVYVHTIGDQSTSDRMVYEEKDPRFYVSVDKSENHRFIYVLSEGNNMSEYYFLDAASANLDLKIIEPRADEHEYEVSNHGEYFYIRTNLDAEDYRLVKTPIHSPTRSHWLDVEPHEPGRLLEGFMLFEDYLVVQERRGGTPNIQVSSFKSGESHRISFAEQAYNITALSSREFVSDELRFSYTSLKTPRSMYSYNMASRERKLLKKQEIPDPSFDENNYISRRIFVPSNDGVEIPVSLLYRKDTPLDGSAPLHLYAYGSYGICLDPFFSISNFSLVDRGFVFAMAHVRGGMELGHQWYAEGKSLKKENTFNDFIACADYLIAHNYTSQGQILASGGSAGGMLMGVVVNRRPELFKAVIAHVPFVDVLNTMLDASLPLTTAEYNEWGDPKERVYFDCIKSYSPYENVKQQAYPPMLVTAGFSDPRVTYWEPSKWVQRLREANTADTNILLRMHMDSGHLGASGRYDSLKEAAEDLAFVALVYGISR